jgi:hypothetical protein
MVLEKIDLDSGDALKKALTFLAISFAMVFLAEIPLLRSGRTLMDRRCA